MVETEKANTYPPVNEFILDDSGLMKWKPSFDTVSVSAIPNGVCLSITQDGVAVSVSLSLEEAAHIASLLGGRHG